MSIPQLSDYSADDIARADWPSIPRYFALIKKSPQTVADRIRLKRHETWLRCALATFHERATAADVCRFWSAQADDLIREAWREAKGSDTMAILALGKLGSEELNLSSDVDLVFVRGDNDPLEQKPIREFQALLNDATESGFALRVDLTLRPGGRSTSLLPSASEFEYHYGYHGEMWERLAYVRMRVLQGDATLVKSIEEFTRKFSFRKHLDYTLLEDLKALRTKIRSEKFETRPNAFHLKLGIGGIRELELFVHALQVIHGGRHPHLRTHSTTEGLKRIKTLGVLPGAECDFLLESYWYLRELENRLHAYEDQQTYLIDLDKGHPALPPGFAPKLKSVCERVSQIVTSLFGHLKPRR
jgi:glutamate-ammonia-ligase adenylyltransferase